MDLATLEAVLDSVGADAPAGILRAAIRASKRMDPRAHPGAPYDKRAAASLIRGTISRSERSNV